MRGAAWLVVLVVAAACGGRQHGESEPPTCGQASASAVHHLRTLRVDLETAGVDPRAELEAACRDDHWSEAAIVCYRDSASPTEALRCADLLSYAQRKHARAIQTAAFDQADRAHARPSTGIPECDDMIAAIDEMVACPNIPDMTKEGILREREGLTSPTSAEDADTVRLNCKAMDQAIRQMNRSVGC